MNAIMTRLSACGRLALCFLMMFISVVLTACPPPDDCLRIANPMIGAQQVTPPFWLGANGGEVYRLRDGTYIVVSPGQTLEDTLKAMEECEPITIVFSTETPTEMTSTPATTTPTSTSTETATTIPDQMTLTPTPVTPTVDLVTPAEITPTQTLTPIVDPGTLTPTPVSSPTAQSPTPTPSIDDDGDGYAVAAGDCDDHDSSINPEADEFCDGIDSDCDWVIDEEPIEGGVPLYFDDDFDGVGGDKIINDNVCYFELPGPIWFSFVTGDCNDEDPEIYPGALELCDGEDNDCDAASDEDIIVDDDFDSYTECQGDCNDTADHVYPGATELEDDADNDCDGTVDEGLNTPTPEVTESPTPDTFTPTPETCDFENFESYVEGPVTTTDYSGFSVTLLAGHSLNYVDFNEDMALCAADNGTDPTQFAFNLDVPTDFLGVLPYSLSYEGLFCGYYAGELIQCLTVYPIADEQYVGLVFTDLVDMVVFDATVTDSICVGFVNTCR